MRRLWWLLPVGGVVVVATGVLPAGSALGVVERVAGVLLFVVAVTVVAKLSAAAGVFDVAARRAARLGGGRTWQLWLLVAALAVACTGALSLDTTAVLLTPVVLALARQVSAPPLLLAMTTVWLANTASLLLPVSNLTNLLALDVLPAGEDVGAYVALVWRPAVTALVVTMGVLAVLHRSELRRPYTVPRSPVAGDRVLFWAAAGVCVALVPAFLSGVPVALSASVAALLLAGITAWRRPVVLAVALVPWRLVLGVLGLFLLVAALDAQGLTRLLGVVAGSASDGGGLLRLAATGAVAANVVDNLPAYLALEPVAVAGSDATVRVAALLIGVDLGPLVTACGSLATLLWADRCRAAGVTVDWWRFAREGLLLVPLLLLACTAALAWT